jgi:UTP--glucose-1-phosphate uridylyltransferase
MIKGVIVAAGYGTRFLPVTRVVPKELLPIVDRPALDWVVSEFAEAGIEDVLVITSRRKRGIEDWFDRDPELEAVFAAEGAASKLAAIRPPSIRASFVRQPRMGGTGDALRLARAFAGADPFVVAYPDDLFGAPNVTRSLIDEHRATGRSVLAAHDHRGEDVSRYGVLDVDDDGGRWRLRRIVEKPPRGQEPSSLVSYGRYLFTPELFPALDAEWARHSGGEFFHIGAINALAAARRVGVRAVDAPRYDTGTPLGYLQAVVDLATQRPDLGPAFDRWLRERFGPSQGR